MNRRGFMGSILALGMAPTIVRADSLMRIVPRDTVLLTGELGEVLGPRFVVPGNSGGNKFIPWKQVCEESLEVIKREYDLYWRHEHSYVDIVNPSWDDILRRVI